MIFHEFRDLQSSYFSLFLFDMPLAYFTTSFRVVQEDSNVLFDPRNFERDQKNESGESNLTYIDIDVSWQRSSTMISQDQWKDSLPWAAIESKCQQGLRTRMTYGVSQLEPSGNIFKRKRYRVEQKQEWEKWWGVTCKGIQPEEQIYWPVLMATQIKCLQEHDFPKLFMNAANTYKWKK